MWKEQAPQFLKHSKRMILGNVGSGSVQVLCLLGRVGLWGRAAADRM